MADKREASSKRKQGSRSSEPAPVRVFARWKPLQAGQTGLQLRLSNTTIEFDVASENKKESKSGRKATTLAVPKTERMHFELHGVFPHNATQAQVYEEAALPLVDDLLAGYNSTLFAYGQTGAGKTFSMYGPDEVLQDVAAAPEVVRGIVPKTCTRIFTAISADAEIVRATVRCSYLEVYNEKVNDLLMLGQDLKLREDKDKGVYIEGLAAIEVDSEQALCNVVTRGNRSRATSSTAMNERSSRGHTIFLMEVSKVKALEGDANKFSTTAAKLYLVDLAGSENVKQSQATSNKELLREAQNINKSLSTLGICIQKLTSGERDHVPYRDSKLTRILAQTLGGNCKTSLLVALRPEAECVHECVATLRFAQRAKKLTTKTSANLTEELAAREGGAGAGGGGETILAADFERKEEELRDQRARLELQLEEEHAHHEAQLQQLQQEARAAQEELQARLAEEHEQLQHARRAGRGAPHLWPPAARPVQRPRGSTGAAARPVGRTGGHGRAVQPLQAVAAALRRAAERASAAASPERRSTAASCGRR